MDLRFQFSPRRHGEREKCKKRGLDPARLPKSYLLLRVLSRATLLYALSFAFHCAAAEPNTLTPDDIAAGWKLLFDGRNLSGWHIYRHSPGSAGGWHVESGWLMNPKSNGRPNGSGGDLVTDTLYKDFELRFEWKLEAGGNSGVEYLFHEDEPKRKIVMYAGDTGDSPMGFEYQILDDPAYPSDVPNRRTAALYSLITPVDKVLHPPGQINTGRIFLRGSHLEHWLNERKVLETEVGEAALNGIIARSKFNHLPGFGFKAPTSIALQDHGSLVAFRDVKIRSLATVPSGVGAPPPAPIPVVQPIQVPASTRSEDWRVWCWLPAQNLWSEFKLDRMTTIIHEGALSVRNTSLSNWPRALLIYRRVLLQGDFSVSAEVRGQLESFDLQSSTGRNEYVTCAGVANDSLWRRITLSRHGSDITATLDGKALSPRTKGVVDSGFLCFKIRPDEEMEIRNLDIKSSPGAP